MHELIVHVEPQINNYYQENGIALENQVRSEIRNKELRSERDWNGELHPTGAAQLNPDRGSLCED